MTLQIGRGVVVAGRYRVEGEIGEGGMGTVWAASEIATKRLVAMKVIRASAHSQAELRRRLLREARAASAVVHPHVVEVLDVFLLDDEAPVLIMELLDGETLATLLEREERLPLDRSAELLVPAISAVGAAHARGIVHRDLKPANIFLASKADGSTLVKVLDFGIAKLFAFEGEPGFTQATRTGSTLGTPSYMAPEQATASKDINHLADVWAFGVILYECLSGIRPIEGDTVGQVVMSLMSTGITPIDQLVVGLPEDVAQLVGRMLSRERALRPPDLAEPFAVLRGYTHSGAPDFGAPASALIEPDEGVVRKFDAVDSVPRPLVESRSRTRSAAVVAGLGVATIAAFLLVDRTRAASTPRMQEDQGRTSATASPERIQQKEAVLPGGRTAATDDHAPSSLATVTATASSPTQDKIPRSNSVPVVIAERSTAARAEKIAALPSPTIPAVPTAKDPPPLPTNAAPPRAASTVPAPGFHGGLAEEVPF